jgi:hypothetical protein
MIKKGPILLVAKKLVFNIIQANLRKEALAI